MIWVRLHVSIYSYRNTLFAACLHYFFFLFRLIREGRKSKEKVIENRQIRSVQYQW